jgi:mRNA interferase MazF
MKCQRGDVLLVNYPFSEGTGSKVRPALVVQCDANNRRLESTLIVQITSRVHLARKEPTQLLIEVASTAGRQSGLVNDSAVACENIYTVRQTGIIRVIGSLPDEVMGKVDDCLKAALEIDQH